MQIKVDKRICGPSIITTVHCTTYQIPLICKVRVGGIFVLFGRARHVLDANSWQRSVAALLAPEAHLLYHGVNLQKFKNLHNCKTPKLHNSYLNYNGMLGKKKESTNALVGNVSFWFVEPLVILFCVNQTSKGVSFSILVPRVFLVWERSLKFVFLGIYIWAGSFKGTFRCIFLSVLSCFGFLWSLLRATVHERVVWWIPALHVDLESGNFHG